MRHSNNPDLKILTTPTNSAVTVSPKMDYSSQFGLIRQKAYEERMSFVKILDYYRARLLYLHTSCPDMAPNLQQYRAEYQTWSSICTYHSEQPGNEGLTATF